MDVYDMPTGCGSKLWSNSFARCDAPCVARLREAGATIVGKTVTTAFASFDPAVTRNPWDLNRTPGGSSSGSAAAVACGMCFAALASQTGGSITRPAGYCGVASLKPTRGRVCVDGVLPLAPTMDHVGVMASCVRDLAIVFEIISGGDGASIVEPVPTAAVRIDRRLAATSRDESSVRFTRLHGFFDELTEPAMAAALDGFDNFLRSQLPHEVHEVDAALPVAFSGVLRRHRIVMAVEAAQLHGERLARHPDDYPPCIRELIEEGLRTSAVEYREALLDRDALASELDAHFRSGFSLSPATTGVAPDRSTTGNPAYNSPWSYTGLPTVSIPIAYSNEGLPLSAQCVGRSGDEASLLAAAAWAERAWSESGGFKPRPMPI